MNFFLAAVAAVATASPSASASPAPSGLGAVFAPIGALFHALFGWIPDVLAWVMIHIDGVIHNLPLTLIILAALIRLVFWPLNTAQFKSMIGMQKIAPKMKKLQARYKDDPQKLQTEMMQLYKTEGVNPLAGCFPMLVQMPVLISVWYAVSAHREMFNGVPFLWIGSSLSQHSPTVPFLNNMPLVAASLANADVILVLIYMVSQYIYMRYTTMPATDPAQAQQMKMMQVVSPLMIGFFGVRANWPSAMVLYWLASNMFTMGQQLYLMRKYHEPLSFIDADHVVTDDVPAEPAAKNVSKKKISANGGAKTYKVKKAKGNK